MSEFKLKQVPLGGPLFYRDVKTEEPYEAVATDELKTVAGPDGIAYLYRLQYPVLILKPIKEPDGSERAG